MARHTLSYADRIFRGGTHYGKYQGGLRGLEVSDLFWVYFGKVEASNSDGVAESQAVDEGELFTLDGDLVTDGVAEFDVPRNVVAAWTGTAVLTVTGTDEYGETVVESSASGTSFAGKKAFKTVTAVTVSANVTSATVGTGKVLGLPFRIDSKGQVIVVSEDGKAETASVVLAGDDDTATATTGDVRGTVAVAGTPDGTKAYSVLMGRNAGSGKVVQFGVDHFGG